MNVLGSALLFAAIYVGVAFGDSGTNLLVWAFVAVLVAVATALIGRAARAGGAR